MRLPPAVPVCAAWCLAVAGGVVLWPSSPELGYAALAAVFGVVALALLLRPLVLPLALVAALLGLARAELPPADAAPRLRAPTHAGARVVVRGEVADDPRPLSGGAEVLVRPGQVVSASGELPRLGNILVRVRGSGNFAVGDQVEAGGRLRLPAQQPGFDRRGYLAQRQAYLELPAAQMTVLRHSQGLAQAPGWLRDSYREAIGILVPEPHAAVLVGVVLGIRAGIPPKLEQDLVATGLVHLMVLSGLKVAVFARLTLGALQPVLGRAATVPVLGLIGLYALAGGATPAAIRAAAMGGLVLVAARLGRQAHVWTSLSLVAAAMLAWRPDYAWDVGFQLSFAGTVAIILLTPAIERRLHRMPGWLREPFAVTSAAQIGTLPLMLTDFHLLSPSAPITNALVLPALPAMVAAGLLLAPLAFVPDAGRLLSLPLVGLLSYLEQVASVGARLPGAAIAVPEFPPWAGLAYYLGLGGAVVATRTRGRARLAALAVAGLGPLLMGSAELVAAARADPLLAVLAVGDGQAVLVSGPQGVFLIDGGPTPGRLSSELGQRLPPWRRDLDALVITAPSLGHIGGLSGFERRAAQVVVAGVQPTGKAWRAAVLLARARGAWLQPALAGQTLGLAGFRVEVLAPEATDPPDEPGVGHLALRVSRFGGPSFCDLSDLDPDAQRVAAARLKGGCDYLLLPSGGRTSPAPELLASAHPRWLIASSAPGHLAPGLPADRVRRTDQEGTVELAM